MGESNIPPRRGRRARRMACVAVIVWVAVTGRHWWLNVPLAPEATFHLTDRQAFEGVSPAGELMISRRSERGEPRFGPVEYRSLPDGKVLRMAFEETDEVHLHHRFGGGRNHSADGRTVIRRKESFWLATLAGDVLRELPGLPGTAIPDFYLKGSRLLWQEESGITLYDVETCRKVARVANNGGPKWELRECNDTTATVTASVTLANGRSSALWRLLSLSTGELDSRFAELAPDSSTQVSPDDRYVLARGPHGATAYDRQSAEKLWSTDITRQGWSRFEERGRFVAVDLVDAWGKLVVLRWSGEDGKPVGAVPANADILASREIIDGVHYSIDYTVSCGRGWERTLNHQLRLFARWLGHPEWWKECEIRSTLYDLAGDRRVGLLYDEWLEPTATPDGRGLVAWRHDTDGESVRYYSLPPRRPWGWLVRWSIAPAVVVLAWVWSRGRRRESTEFKARCEPGLLEGDSGDGASATTTQQAR